MDVTSAHLGVSRDEFLAHLEATRLLPEDEFARLAADPAADPLTLAEALLAGGLLTPFQLDAITSGRPGDLRVGNYDLLAKLGAGGMGTVFKARHRRMKRVVAIKVLAASLCSDPAFVQRFQREVETVARLGHPNVVMAYDADEADIGHFLVMEYVSGRDLASEVEKGGPLGVARAVGIVGQAARGLAYAHAQGIVHRDVKPHNLLLDDGGVVKVTDLGLARLSSAAAVGTSDLTQAGGILGTVDYMPPEQAVDSTSIDARADVYSLGCTLYFLLTGTPPYTGASLMTILLKHRDAEVPLLRRVRPDVPPDLEAVCRRMMAKAPADRYQTMADVLAALEPFADAAPGGPSAAPRGRGAAPDLGGVGETPPAGVSLLIAEPSRVQASIIRQYLEAQGMTVAAVVATGGDAIAAAHVRRPTGMITSLYLADMTGVDLAKQVHAEMRHNAPGVVVISSEAEAADVGTLSKLSRTVTLHKPFTPEQLVQAVNLVTGLSVTVRSSETVAGLSGVRARPKADRTSLRVLIVDDSSAARLHVRTALAGLGFVTFEEAADGVQGIAAATRQAFDLIVTDFNMPLLDGRAVVSYLRQHPPTAAVPILVVTTESAPDTLAALRTLGATAILDKAFPLAVVKPLVDQLFGGSSPGR
jgi:CheY-like chemotaxis protein/tRNA A-37 threonylcarbamoyl transferase component Bud32